MNDFTVVDGRPKGLEPGQFEYGERWIKCIWCEVTSPSKNMTIFTELSTGKTFACCEDRIRCHNWAVNGSANEYSNLCKCNRCGLVDDYNNMKTRDVTYYGYNGPISSLNRIPQIICANCDDALDEIQTGRMSALRELSQLSQDLGLYDKEK